MRSSEFLGHNFIERKKKIIFITQRQRDILAFTSHGLEEPQIAERMHSSPRQTHQERQKLFNKFDCHQQAELVKRAIYLGTIPTILTDLSNLTKIEKETLKIATENDLGNNTYATLAKLLYKTQSTVKSRVSSSLSKLGAHNLAHLITMYMSSIELPKKKGTIVVIDEGKDMLTEDEVRAREQIVNQLNLEPYQNNMLTILQYGGTISRSQLLQEPSLPITRLAGSPTDEGNVTIYEWPVLKRR